MNEDEYVVPPSNGAPNVSGSTPKPPKQPNKVVAWVKSNVATTVAGSVMALIVILFGVAVVTNQKLEIGGISFNPLYNQASCGPEGCSAETFTIEGTFANGTVNVPYTQTFSVNPQTYSSYGGEMGMCNWTVVSVTPTPGFEAAFVQPAGGPGTTASFTSTPTKAGTYQVTIKVSCSNTGQETTKTLPWVVNDPSTDLTIVGNFSEGIQIGFWGGVVINTVNSGGGVCTFKLISVSPDNGSARLDEWASSSVPNESDAQFVMNPQVSGTHTIKIGVSCIPKGGGTPKTAEKEFSFLTAEPRAIGPEGTGLDLETNLADGMVNVPYGRTEAGAVNYPYFGSMAAIGTGPGLPYYCRFVVKNISPSMPNAWIDSGADGTRSTGSLNATPKVAGDYKVTIQTICASRDPRTYSVSDVKFDKVVNWKVLPATTSELDISGTFADGIAGTPFSTQVIAVNGSSSGVYTCALSISSINPAISGAILIPTTPVNSQVAANFTATPQNAGVYTVKLGVTCNPSNPAMGLPSQAKEKVFQWKVNVNQIDPPAPTGTLDISANFTNGVVGTPYATEVKTVNSNGVIYTCTLGLKSITPAITGATLNPTTQLITIGNEKQSTFTATPKAAGNYTIKISAVCDPTNPLSKKVSIEKEKDFIWKVSEATTIIPTPSGELSINATFTNGKVGVAYTTLVSTVNGSSACTLAIVNITPPISGAVLDSTGLTSGTGVGVKSANFKATPTTAGTYTVKISATCPPLVGDGPTKYVEKSFSWIIDAASGSGGSGSGSGSGGTTASLCTSQSSKLIPIYRWWNDRDKDHFYTTNANEKPSGFISEGVSGYVFKEKVAGTTAIYRSYSASLTAHYYSTVDDAEKYGYKTEGILGYAPSSSTTGFVPWYRLHKGWSANDYLETVSTKEKAEAIAAGYADAGTAAYICGSKS